MADFVGYLLRTENLLIMLAVSACIVAIQQVFPALDHNKTWARLLPVLPILGCSLAVWMPGLVAGGASQKMILGVVLGAFAGQGYKLVRQTVFGNDKRIRDHPARL